MILCVIQKECTSKGMADRDCIAPELFEDTADNLVCQHCIEWRLRRAMAGEIDREHVEPRVRQRITKDVHHVLVGKEPVYYEHAPAAAVVDVVEIWCRWLDV